MLFDPIWHPRLVILVALLLLGLLALRAWRERRQSPLTRQAPLLLLRLAVLAIVLLLVCNPHRVSLIPLPEHPRLQVLFDQSASMAVEDVEGRSRWQAAREAFAAAQAAWDGRFDLRLHSFARTLRACSAEALAGMPADGEASALGEALSQGLAHSVEADIGAGVLLLSDGRSTDDSARDAAQLALARGVPLWICPLGGPIAQRDLRLHAPSNEVLAFAGAQVSLAVELQQVGFPGRSFAVQISAGEQAVQNLEALPDAQGLARLTFQVMAPDEGELAVHCSVPLEEGEQRSDNNHSVIYLRAVAKQARVLLLEGQPHWDSKFLVQSLIRCPQVRLTAIHPLANGRRFTVHDDGAGQRGDAPVLPRGAEALAQYDVIILGRGCDDLLADLGPDLLADHVAEHGGLLIFSRGRPVFGRNQVVDALDPLVYRLGEEGGGQLLPADAGRDHAIFDLSAADDDAALLADLPALDAIQASEGTKPLAAVLARAGVEAQGIAMAHQPYGQGRVLTVNAAGLWRWAFHERRNAFDEYVYDRLWLGVLRWMLAGSDFRPGHNIALQCERRILNDEQSLHLLVRSRGLPDFRPVLRLIGAEGEQELSPRAAGDGRFLVEAGPFAAGDYRVELSAAGAEPERLSLQVRVLSASIERREPSADRALLAALATASDGRIVEREELGRLPALLEQWHSQRQLSDRDESLWDRAWLLALLLALLGCEWYLRRRGGLL
jgi:hypothetical protein